MQPPLAKAEARAGQILAEMLGMVCHREYIREYAEQTVHSPQSDSLSSGLVFMLLML